jgi:hypothetical protein
MPHATHTQGLGVAFAYYFAVSAPIKADVAKYYKNHPTSD